MMVGTSFSFIRRQPSPSTIRHHPATFTNQENPNPMDGQGCPNRTVDLCCASAPPDGDVDRAVNQSRSQGQAVGLHRGGAERIKSPPGDIKRNPLCAVRAFRRQGVVGKIRHRLPGQLPKRISGKRRCSLTLSWWRQASGLPVNRASRPADRVRHRPVATKPSGPWSAMRGCSGRQDARPCRQARRLPPPSRTVPSKMHPRRGVRVFACWLRGFPEKLPPERRE